MSFGFSGKSAEDVVCFVALNFVNRDLESAHNFFDAGELRIEFVRPFGASGFVVFVLFVAESLTFEVEGTGDVIRLFVVKNIEKHRGEAINGVSEFTVWSAESLRHSMKGPVDYGVTVDENQFFHVF